jgi:hypothetical protein
VNGDQSDNGTYVAGAAYVFVRTGTSWSQQAYLKASNTGFEDDFGLAVAVADDTIVVGARDEDSSATGIDGDQGDNASFAAGAAYVFERSGTSWSQKAYVKASNTDEGDWFGCSLAIASGTAVIGAIFEAGDATGVNGDEDNNGAAFAGAAYVFDVVPEPSAFCFGGACPCGNDSASTGCVNSTGSGALLDVSGSTSVSADDLVLTTSGCPPGNTGLYLLGTVTFSPVVLGDGLTCIGFPFRYPPGVVDGAGVFTLTNPVAGAFPVTFTAGDTHYFQAWTRDVLCGPPPAPCPSPCGSNSNLSNGYSVVFSP